MLRQSATGGLRRPVGGLVLSLACLLSTACGSPGAGPDAGTPDGSVVAEGCDEDFTFRPPSTSTSVFFVAEWDGFDRLAHPMKDDGSGSWRLSIRVPYGDQGYYFLANGAEYLPDGAEKVQRAGKTVSLFRGCELADGFIQTVTLAGVDPSASITVTAAVREPGGLSFPDSTWRPLTAAEAKVKGNTVAVKLTNLADGKYTVRLRPSQGSEVVLPFWIEPKRFDWRGTPLYMLMTDRFRDGDPTNNPPATAGVSDGASFKGGDLKGVEMALQEGYFDKLGVKAIWITPWQTQPQGAYPDDTGTQQVLGYHGYWPVKAREVDPRFGGGAALASMVKEAHQHGIRIVMDTVLNHVSIQHEYFKDPAKAGWFRTGCNCGQPGCGWDDTPARYYCLFNANMPDVNWTVPEAASQFSSDVLWWMDTFDLDGLRIDAAKHIEPEGIQTMASKVRARFETAGTKVYMFGESYTGNLDFLKEDIGPDKLDSQLNFPVWFAVPEPIFGRDDKGLQAAKGTIDWSAGIFPDYMVTFIGSHDAARFITKADTASRDKQGNKWSDLPGMPTEQRAYDRSYLALLNLVTTPGVPLLYYGDEYGEWGGSDPDNRHMLKAEGSLNDQQKGLLARVRKLMTVRGQLHGLATGTMQELWCNSEPWGDPGAGGGNLWAYARVDSDPKQTALVVLNLKYETYPAVKVDFPVNLGWTSGTVVDALTDKEFSFSNATVTLDVPGRGGVILHLK